MARSFLYVMENAIMNTLGLLTQTATRTLVMIEALMTGSITVSRRALQAKIQKVDQEVNVHIYIPHIDKKNTLIYFADQIYTYIYY